MASSSRVRIANSNLRAECRRVLSRIAYPLAACDHFIRHGPQSEKFPMKRLIACAALLVLAGVVVVFGQDRERTDPFRSFAAQGNTLVQGSADVSESKSNPDRDRLLNLLKTRVGL